MPPWHIVKQCICAFLDYRQAKYMFKKGAVTFDETEKARGEKKKVPFSGKIRK